MRELYDLKSPLPTPSTTPAQKPKPAMTIVTSPPGYAQRMSPSMSPLELPRAATTGAGVHAIAGEPAFAEKPILVGEYLGNRLLELGVEHCFGVPGDYSLGLCDQLITAGLRWVGCCNELNAGYAADAYARSRGLSAACVTYGVGGFSAINACAGAHAESVPLVLISGAPPSSNYVGGFEWKAMPHHALQNNLHSQQQAFSAVTARTTLILSPRTAADQIDETLRICLVHCRPVFFEIPSDIALQDCEGASDRLKNSPARNWDSSAPYNPTASAEALALCSKLLLGAERPALLAGVEVTRRDAQGSVRRLARMLRLPVTTTRHGKTAIEEGGTICAGVYAGSLSPEPVRQYVERSDVLLLIGAPKTDMDFFLCSIDEHQTTVIGIAGGQVTVHEPVHDEGSELTPADEQAQPSSPRKFTRVRLTSFGPISLRLFIDSLALVIFDHLGDVAPLLASPLARSGPRSGPGSGSASSRTRPPADYLQPGAAPVDSSDRGAHAAAGPIAGADASSPKERDIMLRAVETWDGAMAAAIAAAAHRTAAAMADSELKADVDHAPSAAPKTLTSAMFFKALQAWLWAQPVPVTILADTGESLFSAANLELRPNDIFITQAFYCSIGFTVPAAIGVAHAARSKAESASGTNESAERPGTSTPSRRFVCLVGDGAFQMTAQEVSTAVRDSLPITYIILNNGGYGIERVIHTGPKENDYNALADWRYADLARAFRLGEKAAGRAGVADVASCAADLQAALAAIDEHANMRVCNLLEVKVNNDDFSDALRSVGATMRNQLKDSLHARMSTIS